MGKAEDRVLDEALSLPADARISLVERLLTSLNLPAKEEIDRLWADEVERRVGEIERGEVELISGEQIFENVRKNTRNEVLLSSGSRTRTLSSHRVL